MSKHNGYIKVDPSHLKEGSPLDTGMIQDIVINNADALWESHGQIRVNLHFSGATFQQSYRGIRGDTPSPGLYLMRSFGPFPVSLTKEGYPMPLYVKINGFATGSVHLPRVGLRRWDQAPFGGDGSGLVTSKMGFCSFPANGSGSWETVSVTTSDGSSSTMVQLNQSDTEPLRPIPTRLTSSDSSVNVNSYMMHCFLDLYSYRAATGTGEHYFELNGILVREWFQRH